MMTNKQTKHYQDEVVRYMELFGLGQWSIRFDEWDDIADEGVMRETAEAVTEWDTGSRFVRFGLNPAYKATDAALSRSAVHEVTHVLTAKLFVLAGQTDVSSEEAEAIAKSMERAFYGPVEV